MHNDRADLLGTDLGHVFLCRVEVTGVSANKQHTLSHSRVSANQQHSLSRVSANQQHTRSLFTSVHIGVEVTQVSANKLTRVCA
jgi:hypothetical protein